MARRYDDEGELPWPKHLAEFDPAKWRDRQEWHKARAEVARSLGRPVLPEVRGMTRVKPGRNGRTLR
jgi:hypothetical protein